MVRKLGAILFSLIWALSPASLPSQVMQQNIAGGVNQFVPTNVSGLLFWYEANIGVTCTGGCTNNAAVTAWNDQSAHANNLTASGTVTYKTAQVNGLPGILLSSGSGFFTLGSAISWPGTESVFVVFADTNVTVAAPLVSGTLMAGGTFEYKLNASAHQRLSDTNVTNIGDGTATLVNGVFHQANATYNSSTGAWVLRIDEGADASGTQVTSPTNSQTAIGSDDANQGNSTIVEIFAYNTVVSAADKAGLEGYLKAKYGI